MKKLIIFLIIVILAATMNGCMYGGGSSGVSWGNSKFDLEYENIKVEETHDFKMKKDDIMKVSVISEKGKIKITIEDSNGNDIYSGNNLPTSEFNVEIKNDDIYTIKVYGRRVTGELHFRLIKNY